MQRFVVVLTAWVWLGSVAGFFQPHYIFATDTLWVFKLDGTVHCGPPEGIAPEVMARELTASGIPVLAVRKGHDGREGIALCGQPTGQINLYEIPAVQRVEARQAGFRPWSGSIQPSPVDDFQGDP